VLELRHASLELVDAVPQNLELRLLGELSLRRMAEPR